MGQKLTKEETEARRRSKLVDGTLKKEKEAEKKQLKLLLLGTGKSGKSTILKQIRLLYGSGYDDLTRRHFLYVIHSNLKLAMKTMFEAMDSFRLRLKSPELEAEARAYLAHSHGPMDTPVELFKKLWTDPVLVEVYKRRQDYDLNDSTSYFMESLDRISQKKYTPTDQDVLRAREATTAVQEYNFTYNQQSFKMVDVGGQKTERRKWIHCFDNVTAIIYLVGLSDFDQRSAEAEGGTNKLRESLSLFRRTVRGRWFQNTTVILFLNKDDLLIDKISSGTNIRDTFPEFSGNPRSVQEVREFFLQLFKNEMPPHNVHQFYHYFTTATDTGLIAKVFESIRVNILDKRMDQFHL
eukprot:m.150626 g.150626  ORF g.150626 m.150626 type:complete len:352 (-) comp15027_c0_seq3:1723-2778(-)